MRPWLYQWYMSRCLPGALSGPAGAPLAGLDKSHTKHNTQSMAELPRTLFECHIICLFYVATCSQTTVQIISSLADWMAMMMMTMTTATATIVVAASTTTLMLAQLSCVGTFTGLQSSFGRGWPMQNNNAPTSARYGARLGLLDSFTSGKWLLYDSRPGNCQP